MDRVFQYKSKDAPPHRWLGLRPVDFVRAAERRAAVLTRVISGKRAKGLRRYRLSAMRYPLPAP